MNCQLGNDLVLGETVLDRMGKIRINLQDLTSHQFNGFLPTGSDHVSLKQLVKFLMTDQFEVEIQLQTKDEINLQSSLEGDNAMMGWNTCLGDPISSENYSAVIIV